MRLADHVVVVTGATGIAAAGARRFVSEGASVFIVSIDEDQCRHLAAELEGAGPIGWSAADLTDEAATEAAFAACLERFGAVTGLYAVVGASGRGKGDGPLDQIPLEGWRHTMDINTVPPFLAAREAVKSMKRRDAGGSVVLIGSISAMHPSQYFVTHAYAASKGAAISLTRSLASHYASDRIRVNLIAPGLVDTPMSIRAASDPPTVAYAREKQPLAGGFLDPSDIAAAAVFLLSDESAQITGQVLEVDGGWGVTEA
ncbi:MAG TPA: SDR family oxidoreductase [Acidimicrobiia bacterium]|nr:SDR family oxidoreductase [Acidimicrobiia bacterium]